MKETFYFPHDYHARHDKNLNNLFLDHGLKGIGAYWCLVEMLYEEGGLLQTKYERIAKALHTDVGFISAVISLYDLFETDDTNFWSNSVNRRLEERRIKSESARTSVNKRWNKNTNVLRTQYEGNTIKESKVKEKKVNNTDYFTPPDIKDVSNYCQERKNNVDPQKWHDFYSSKGWMIGKNKMKDWKAAVRTWEKNKGENNAPKRKFLN